MDRPARECADKLIGRRLGPKQIFQSRPTVPSNRRSLIALAGLIHVFAVVILDLMPNSSDKSKIIKLRLAHADLPFRRRRMIAGWAEARQLVTVCGLWSDGTIQP
jgi:hypothetical protein